jgi:hypothetical protein
MRARSKKIFATWRTTMKKLIAIYVLGLGLLGGCGEDFKPGSRIESPRILALQADRSFARPGEDVALTLLAANPHDEPLEWAWTTCTLPPSSTVDDCLETLDGDLERFEPATDTLSVSIPRDVLDGIPEGLKPSALIGVVVVACPGELRSGETLGVPTRCVDEQGRERSIDDLEVGIKRIMIRESDRNENPEVLSITWDGASWDEDEVQEAEVCDEETFVFDDCSSLQRRIHVITSDRESGRDEFGGDFTEQVIVQFYSTHGLFRDQVRIAEDADNRWVAQHQDGGDEMMATLWFIARDDRGGVAWTTRKVALKP